MKKLLEKIKQILPKKKKKHYAKYWMTIGDGLRVEVSRPPSKIKIKK